MRLLIVERRLQQSTLSGIADTFRTIPLVVPPSSLTITFRNCEFVRVMPVDTSRLIKSRNIQSQGQSSVSQLLSYAIPV
jgi:hypothetical protein